MFGTLRNASFVNSTQLTPNKRISFSALCTSPGTLQDVTMDNPFNFGYRTQSGGSPTVHGRSLREVEEQMSQLRKDNFNLKLRIYFLEEKVPGLKNGPTENSESRETLLKQLIDTKVALEALRLENESKQKLLQEAADAMTAMENMQNNAEARSTEIIEDLRVRIQELEQRQTASEISVNDVVSVTLAEKKVEELEAALLEARLQATDYVAEIETLTQKVAELETNKNGNRFVEAAGQHSASLAEEIQNLKSSLADKTCELQEAEDKLKEQAKVHDNACRTIQTLTKALSKQQQSKDINTSCAHKDNTYCSELSNSQKQTYELKLAEQEETIKALKMEIKKKTANLQNLVNKELWEKNREIERLTKQVANKEHAAPGNESVNATESKESITAYEHSLVLQDNEILKHRLRMAIERYDAVRDNQDNVAQLRQELRQARDDAANAEKWRTECAEVCNILTNRLEELAGFLNTLLKHKDVLGVLAEDRRRAMLRAVDHSLDLSKSLNITLSVSGLSITDTTFGQLVNLSEIINDAEENITFNSHEDSNVPMVREPPITIETLKAENSALKKELEKRHNFENRKDRRSLPVQAPQHDDNQSESEAWSEPDRKVSLARMGLEDPTASTSKDIQMGQKFLSDSESDANQNTTRQSAKQERSRAHERIAQLEQLIKQRDERILKIQCQLVETDNRLKQENLHVIELTRDLDALRDRNEALHADLMALGMQEQKSNNDNTILHDLVQKTDELEKLQTERCRLIADAQVVEMELNALRVEMDEMQVKHEIAMQLAANREEEKLKQLKRDMDVLLEERLMEQVRKHEEIIARDYVATSNYEQLKKQMIELQRQYAENLRTLEYQEENAQALKQNLIDNELATRALTKQLDESTLQASKAIMERTKASNDKLQLEETVERLKQHVIVLENDKAKMMEALKREKIQKQKHQQQQQKEMERQSDASQSGYTSEEMQLAVNDDGKTTAVCQQRLTAVGNERMNNSSPDLGIESDAGRVSSVELSQAQHALLKTLEIETQNDESPVPSSPSSLDTEANIDANASGVAVATTTAGNAAITNIVHDCVKVEQENAELRLKLIRTKRAFEDTYEKLRLANKAKAQVEKDIKNQILKTHNVLRNVRSNMENEKS